MPNETTGADHPRRFYFGVLFLGSKLSMNHPRPHADGAIVFSDS